MPNRARLGRLAVADANTAGLIMGGSLRNARYRAATSAAVKAKDSRKWAIVGVCATPQPCNAQRPCYSRIQGRPVVS